MRRRDLLEEAAGIRAKVVNARHVKNVPGRKTDGGDAQWLATLARAGLLRGSFVPPSKLRELRLISRQRQKLVGQLSSEKNRLHKVLTDGGIRLGVAVSDLERQGLAAAPTANAEAYRLYLQGREYRSRPGQLRQNDEIAEPAAVEDDMAKLRSIEEVRFNIHFLRHELSFSVLVNERVGKYFEKPCLRLSMRTQRVKIFKRF